MKKHLIAAAVAAAVAVPAMAQTVTIYGTMDIGYSDVEYRQSNSANGRDIRSTGNGDGGLSTSLLGFRGSEDLGGGLKAGFNLEYDLTDAANGGALGATRRSFLTLENNLGQLKLGQDTSAIHGVIAGFSAGFANNTTGALYTNGGTFGSGATAGAAASGNDAANNDGVRPHAAFTPGMISYTSPDINGFRARVDYAAYSDDAAAGATLETRETGLSLTYTSGPLSLGLGWQDRSQEQAASSAALTNTFFGIAAGNINAINYANAAATQLEKDVLALGGSYNFGIAQPFVLWTKSDAAAGPQNGAVNEVFTQDLLEVGVRIPQGAMTYFGSIYNGESEWSAANDFTAFNANNGQTDHDGWQVGALYALSKRTTAYAIYGNSETQNSTTRTTAASVGSESTMYTIGVRHSF